MCGIAGYVGLDQGAGEAVLARMARQLLHRGPEGHRSARQAGVGLVHRNGDPVSGAGPQPVRSPDGRWILVHHGLAHHHREQLRRELAAAGHLAAGDGDAVLAAWQAWGTAAFNRIRGGFALAVVDTTSGEVVLARDELGVASLYLAADGSGRVAFASEIRPVLAAAVVPRRPDDTTVHRYLSTGRHDDTERTFFAGVSRVLPGQLARITPDGSVHRQTYTRLRHDLDWLAAAPRPYDRQAREQIADGLVAAVRRGLAGDAPVGTVLSGDLQDSTVVALVDRLLHGPEPEPASVGEVQQAFSVASGTGAADQDRRRDVERPLHAVTAGCGHRLALHQVRPDATDLIRDLTDLVRTQEEPVRFEAGYAQYFLMRAASRQVRVVLDGSPADLMFAGHPRHAREHLRELVRRRRYVAAAIEWVGSTRWRGVSTWWHDRRRRRITAERLLEPGFAAAHAGAADGAVGTSDLKRMLADDLFRDELPALLRAAGRNAARFGVEHRAAFLDPALLRLLWGLDNAALISGGSDRRALRDATAGLLPRPARRRRGTGGGAPEWWGGMRNVVYEILSSDSFGARGYVDQTAATAAFRAVTSGQASAEPGLFWRLINVELWLREFIDADPTVPRAVLGVRPAAFGLHPAAAGVSAADAGPPVPDWEPNPERRLVSPDGRWARYPLPAGAGVRDDLAVAAGAQAAWFFVHLTDAPPGVVASVLGRRWYLCCSDPMVAAARRAGPPRDPSPGPGRTDAQRLARHLSATVRGVVPPQARRHFGGTVVIDTRSPGGAVLGHDTDLPTERLAGSFADDPLGRSGTPSPFAVLCALSPSI